MAKELGPLFLLIAFACILVMILTALRFNIESEQYGPTPLPPGLRVVSWPAQGGVSDEYNAPAKAILLFLILLLFAGTIIAIGAGVDD